MKSIQFRNKRHNCWSRHSSLPTNQKHVEFKFWCSAIKPNLISECFFLRVGIRHRRGDWYTSFRIGKWISNWNNYFLFDFRHTEINVIHLAAVVSEIISNGIWHLLTSLQAFIQLVWPAWKDECRFNVCRFVHKKKNKKLDHWQRPRWDLHDFLKTEPEHQLQRRHKKTSWKTLILSDSYWEFFHFIDLWFALRDQSMFHKYYNSLNFLINGNNFNFSTAK